MPLKQGIVIQSNRRRCIAIVHVCESGYVVLDWTAGTEPRRGDVIQGGLKRCGRAKFENLTSSTSFSGYVHLVDCCLESAEAYIA